ncbi:MAG: phosphoribosylformylglycinamidine synthase subunit PurS [Bifidobacteriaceae bacterium]|nr:phosphoribosylformylglycinamidine synthase subunit PurS [Bifidobacteriaceae bacterium]
MIVDVMPKPEILDPQGKAVASALARLGLTQFRGVRQGKRFELEVEGPATPEVVEAAREAAATLLSNPIIEDVVAVRLEPDAVEAGPLGPLGPAGPAGPPAPGPAAGLDSVDPLAPGPAAGLGPAARPGGPSAPDYPAEAVGGTDLAGDDLGGWARPGDPAAGGPA